MLCLPQLNLNTTSSVVSEEAKTLLEHEKGGGRVKRGERMSADVRRVLPPSSASDYHSSLGGVGGIKWPISANWQKKVSFAKA